MRLPTDRRDETSGPRGVRGTRRQFLRDAVLMSAGAYAALARAGRAEDVCRDDTAIDETTALIVSGQAPLQPGEGLKDARAVWCHVPEEAGRRVLVYFHGHNGYVTVDAQGRSRVPDWAAGQASARAGASAKSAAPLVYGLDRLGPKLKAKEPMVLVPEVSTLATGSFWAKEPAGQYADRARLRLLVEDCRHHLACLPRPGGGRYVPPGFEKGPIEPRLPLAAIPGSGIPWRKPQGRR